MRDPDLIVRAQQAATALEGAWCRWRMMHGLAADPAPAVSSYVGYSLDAPWGQPRIVFGICAEEADLLARLLDRHDCVGPVHASLQARTVGPTHDSLIQDGPNRNGQGPDGHSQNGRTQEGPARDGGSAAEAATIVTQAGAAEFVHVPAPAPASAGQQPIVPSSSRPGAQPGSAPGIFPREAAAAALTSQQAPRRSGIGTPIALAASRAVEASIASREAAAASSAAPAAPAPARVSTERAVSTEGAVSIEGAVVADNAVAAEDDVPAAQAGYAEPGQADQLADAGRLGRTEQHGHDGQAPQVGQGLARERNPAAEPGPAPQRDCAAGPAGPPDPGPPGIVAFRPRTEPVSWYPDGRAGDEAVAPDPAEPPGQFGPAEPPRFDSAGPQPGGEQTRPGRVLRGATRARLKRPGGTSPDRGPAVADGAGRPQPPARPKDGRDRVSSAAAASDAAAWNASELPGQAAVTDTAV